MNEACQSLIHSHRMFLSAMLLAGIRDSVYYHPAPDESVRNPNTLKSRHYSHKAANKNRLEARDWIRSAEMARSQRGLGFGYVWSQLETIGSITWSIDRFIKHMEKIWEACDKNTSLGAEIIKMIGIVLGETDGRQSQVDISAPFKEIRHGSV